jgi:NADH-quinone oxidoreductase subunit E
MTALNAELRERINDLLSRYPNKQAVTLPALHLVQDRFRCVSLEAVREIADMLDLSPAEVSDTMTFYGFFRGQENPLGQTRVWVCRSLPCMLRGGEELLKKLSEALGTQPGGTSHDDRFSLEFAECLGACEGAPCLLIHDEHRLNFQESQIPALVQGLSGAPVSP